MFLKENKSQNCTKTIIRLLDRIYSLIEESDLDSNIYKLQSRGFNLDSINTSSYNIIGIFKNKNYTKEIQIPFYKINEDILDQLESVIEQYNTYSVEKQINTCENEKNYNIREKEFIDLYLSEINWNKVYHTSIYAKIALNTIIELLYAQLNEELKRT